MPHKNKDTDKSFILRTIKKDSKISAPAIKAAMDYRVFISISSIRNVKNITITVEQCVKSFG